MHPNSVDFLTLAASLVYEWRKKLQDQVDSHCYVYYWMGCTPPPFISRCYQESEIQGVNYGNKNDQWSNTKGDAFCNLALRIQDGDFQWWIHASACSVGSKQRSKNIRQYWFQHRSFGAWSSYSNRFLQLTFPRFPQHFHFNRFAFGSVVQEMEIHPLHEFRNY